MGGPPTLRGGRRLVLRTTRPVLWRLAGTEQQQRTHRLQAVATEHGFSDASDSSQSRPLPLANDKDVSLNVQAYVDDRITDLGTWLRDDDLQSAQSQVLDRQDSNVSECPTVMEQSWESEVPYISLFPELDMPYRPTLTPEPAFLVTCDGAITVPDNDSSSASAAIALPTVDDDVNNDNCNVVQSVDCDVATSTADVTVAIPLGDTTDRLDKNNNDAVDVNTDVADIVTKKVIVMIDARLR